MNLKELADQLRTMIESLNRGDPNDDPDDATQASLRAVAMAALRLSTPYPGVQLIGKIEWWDGCNCHGSDMHTELEWETLEEMGRAIASHGHGEVSDLQDVKWSIPLSENERSTLFEAFERGQKQTATRKVLRDALEKANKEHGSAVMAMTRISKEIQDGRSDFNDVALARKLGELTIADTLVIACAARRHEAEKALVRLEQEVD